MIALQPVGLLGDDAQEAPGRVGVVERAVEQRLGEALDRGDRRLELVRDVGDEVAADRLEPLEPGDVVEHDARRRRRVVARRAQQQRAVGLQVAVLGADAHDDVGLDRPSPASVSATTRCRSGLRTTSWMVLPSSLGRGRCRAAARRRRSRRSRAPRVSTARTPSTMLESTASRSLRSRVSVPKLVVELVRHTVQALRDGRELLGARHVQLVREVAGGEPLGAALDVADGAG